MLRNLVKIILSVLIIGFTGYILTPFFTIENDATGTITITIIDQNGVSHSDNLTFLEEDNLFELMNNHYTLECASITYQADPSCSYMMMGSHIIMSIDDLKTNWSETYIEILVNGERSMYGIDLIPLEDNMTITFQYQTIE